VLSILYILCKRYTIFIQKMLNFIFIYNINDSKIYVQINMNAISTGNYLKRDLRGMFAVRNNCISEETAFCKQDNLQQSLNTLNEVMR